jgi:hypothetical protein
MWWDSTCDCWIHNYTEEDLVHARDTIKRLEDHWPDQADIETSQVLLKQVDQMFCARFDKHTGRCKHFYEQDSSAHMQCDMLPSNELDCCGYEKKET